MNGADSSTPPPVSAWLAKAGTSKWTLVVILVVALGLRLFGLGDQNLWYDEQLTVQVSQHSGTELLTALQAESHKPPLYFMLMHPWLEWGRSEFWIRLPSALCGVAACWVAWWLGRVVLGHAVGWLVGAMLAVLPFHVYYSQEARMYALLALTGAGAMLFLCRYAETRGGREAGLYLLCAVLSCYTFTYGVFLMPFACLYVLLHRPKLNWQELALFWGANVAAAMLFLPWVPKLLATMSSGSGLHTLVRASAAQASAYSLFTLGLGATFGPTTEQLRTLGRRVFNEDPFAGSLLLLGVLLVGMILAVGLRALWREQRNGFYFAALGLATFSGLPALLNFWNPGIPFNARYAILSLIPWAVVLAAFAGQVLRPGIFAKVLGLLYGGCLVVSLGNNYFDSRYARDDVRAAASWLTAMEPAPASIIVCAGFMEPSLAYYYHGPSRILPLTLGTSDDEAELNRNVAMAAGAGEFAVVYVRPEHGDPRRVLLPWLKARYETKMERTWTGVNLILFAPPSKTPGQMPEINNSTELR